MSDNNNNNKESWKLVKEIPIALIIALIMQLCGGIWWAATFSQEMKTLIKEVASIKSETYTQKEADKDKAIFNLKFDDINRRVQNIEDRK